jgi:hypothetical protein
VIRDCVQRRTKAAKSIAAGTYSGVNYCFSRMSGSVIILQNNRTLATLLGRCPHSKVASREVVATRLLEERAHHGIQCWRFGQDFRRIETDRQDVALEETHHLKARLTTFTAISLQILVVPKSGPLSNCALRRGSQVCRWRLPKAGGLSALYETTSDNRLE